MSLMSLYDHTPLARAVTFMHRRGRATLREIAAEVGLRLDDARSLLYLAANMVPERIYQTGGRGFDAVFEYLPERES